MVESVGSGDSVEAGSDTVGSGDDVNSTVKSIDKSSECEMVSWSELTPFTRTLSVQSTENNSCLPLVAMLASVRL